jgi:hypothetical protein
MSTQNLNEPASNSESQEEESLESMLLEAALHQQAYEAKERARPRRTREELKACILAFLRLLPDAPGK